MARKQRASLGERVRQKRLARDASPSAAPAAAPDASPVSDAPPAPAPEAIAEPPPSEAPRPREPTSEAPREDDLALLVKPSSPRWAWGALLAAALIGVVAVGVFRSKARSPVKPASVVVAPTAVIDPPRPAPPPPPPPPAASAPASATAPAPASAPASTTDASATPPPSASAPAASATALRDHALALLQEAKNPEAMAAARSALDADPTDAMPYLVLGSALQDTGKWVEAHRTYELCVKVATRGMLDECRAMLRRKQ